MQSEHGSAGRVCGRAPRWVALVITGALTAVATIAAPLAAQSKACFRNAGGSPWVLTGAVASGAASACTPNSAWERVVPYAMAPAGATSGMMSFTFIPPANSEAQGNLFFGFTIANDPNFSERDVVQLIFDRNNNDVLDAGDFYLLIRLGPALPTPGPITTGTKCSQPPATVEYYERVGNNWQLVDDPSVTAGVKVAAAYDYQAGGGDDAETNLWNVEIQVPYNTPRYQLGKVAPFFGVAAYVYVDYNAGSNQAQTGEVLRWPAALPARAISQSNLNSSPLADASAFANADLTNACYNVSFAGGSVVPWRINNAMAAANDHRINRGGGNKFSVEYYYSGPGNASGSGPNAGMVELDLKPYYAGSPSGQPWTQSKSVVAAEFNKTYRVEFLDPVSSYPSNVNFLCATMRLKGFQYDDIATDNSLTVNYNYFSTSEYKQAVDISADSVPGVRSGDTTTLFLHFATRNDPAATQVGMLPTGARLAGAGGSGAPWLAGGVGFVLAGVVARRRRRLMLVALLAGGGMLVQGCLPILRPPATGGGRWQIANAAELGLRAVPEEPGWFTMPMRVGETRQLQLTFAGRPLPYTPVAQRLSMRGDDGGPARWSTPVHAGQVVTVLAFGTVDVDGPGPQGPTSASGFVRDAANIGRESRGYLLSATRYEPSQYVGALIGSFDDFRTSFVIGTDASIVVPRGAERLTLAINGSPADYRLAQGAYDLRIIVTPAPSVPTVRHAGFDTPIDRPNFLPIWEVLTTTSVYTYYETHTVGRDGGITSRTRTALGAAHMSIYESHDR